MSKLNRRKWSDAMNWNADENKHITVGNNESDTVPISPWSIDQLRRFHDCFIFNCGWLVNTSSWNGKSVVYVVTYSIL